MAQTLPTAILGRTGLEVTRLGYGVGEFRGPRLGGPEVTGAQAGAMLGAILDEGINYIDTSPDYGPAEELIGKYISHRRSEYYLATKGSCEVVRRDEHSDEMVHVWTVEHLVRGFDESLRRMKTDYVDLMQLHNPSVEECEQGRLVEALQEIKKQGKARWIGMSVPPRHAPTVPSVPTFMQWGVFDVFLMAYSAFNRELEEWVTKAAESGIGTALRSVLAKGQPGVGVGRIELWRKYEEAGLDELREEGDSRTSFLLRFALTHPQGQMTIVGMLTPEQLRENVRTVLKGPLPPSVYAEAKRRLGAAGMSPAAVA